ncbi:hypothetical protein ACIQMP_07645 [Streptomyces sp. NPDC091385]|uniref:hypothetical protein n=1 Tax=Streptomyces sp. NPDC091385 TaxID=3365997 RepID=UPI0038259A72
MRVRPSWRTPPPGIAVRCRCYHAHALFRVLLCRAHSGPLVCDRRWFTRGPAQHAAADLQRATHEALCTTGLYTAAHL